MAGYGIGWGVGFRLLRRYGRYIGLTDRRLAYGRALFRRHGVKVVFASRFIVLLRTLAALLAGANRMPRGRFMAGQRHRRRRLVDDSTASAPMCSATRRSKSPDRVAIGIGADCRRRAGGRLGSMRVAANTGFWRSRCARADRARVTNWLS